MPISFDAWKNKNAGAALITQERNELLTSFSGGAQRVVDNLWTAGEKNLANQFSDFVSKSLYIKYDPAEVEEAGQAEEVLNGINTLGKLSAFLDEEAENGKTNFQILMEQGTQGDDYTASEQHRMNCTGSVLCQPLPFQTFLCRYTSLQQHEKALNYKLHSLIL